MDGSSHCRTGKNCLGRSGCIFARRLSTGRSSSISDGGGAVMGDVTQYAREMIETLRLVEHKASKLVKIDDFVTLFSQEIRNPISSAMNHLQLLSEGEYGKLTAAQSEAVNAIVADVEAVVNLIFVASDFAHGENAKRRWQPKTIAVSALAEDLESEARV